MDVIIVARMGSSRLPGKTLKKIGNNCMIEVLIKRLKYSKKIDRIILSTTLNKEDDELYNWAKTKSIDIFRGSSENVLQRIKKTADFFNINNFVFILGDNPLVDYRLVDYCIDTFLSSKNLDFLTTFSYEYNEYCNSKLFFPVGIRVQILSKCILDDIFSKVSDNYNQEHSTSYIIQNINNYNVKFIDAAGKFSKSNLKNYNLAVNNINQFNDVDLIFKFFDYRIDIDINSVVDYINSRKEKFNNLKIL